jgi:hypothetical protein
MKTIKLKLSELIFDPEIYPRGSIDRTRVNVLTQARLAGEEFPPLVIDETTRKVIDGFHRGEVYKADDNDNLEVECIAKHYSNDGEMLLDAVRMNARHGLPLSPFDRARAAMKCRKFGLGAMAVAAALGMRMHALKAIGEGRTAVVTPCVEPHHPARHATPIELPSPLVPTVAPQIPPQTAREVVLKRSVDHLRGQNITQQQEQSMLRLSDRKQSDTVEELITLLESGLIDRTNFAMMSRLRHVGELLANLFANAPVA